LEFGIFLGFVYCHLEFLMSLKTAIKSFATQALGFDACRFSGLKMEGRLKAYRKWLAKQYHGDMRYLERHFKFKEDPQLLLPGARSAIVVIKSYRNTPQRKLRNRFKIARYAVGRDYHNVMRERMERLADFIRQQEPAINCYLGVDSRPIMERGLAIQSGIGFLGKNTMVIRPGLGSYFFIGVILTTHPFLPDAPLKRSCGRCRLCIAACPTGALKANSVMDARKCISYLTIENKSALLEQQARQAKGWVFGCDICQEVCPHNRGQKKLTDWKEFLPESGVGFDFFEKAAGADAPAGDIPKDSALYRSRKLIKQNHPLFLKS